VTKQCDLGGPSHLVLDFLAEAAALYDVGGRHGLERNGIKVDLMQSIEEFWLTEVCIFASSVDGEWEVSVVRGKVKGCHRKVYDTQLYFMI